MEVRFVVVDPGSPEAERAMAQYFDELDRRFPGGFDREDAATAIRDAASRYQPPTGAFLLALAGGDTVGCGAVDLLDDVTAEVKRMWVAPSARGRGLGRQLLERLEEEAARAGRTTVVLDTNASLTEAIAMYEAAGYRAVERYNDNPYAERWFAKRLDPEEGP